MCIIVNALHCTVCVCVSAEPEGSGFTAGWISIETMANLVFPLEWGNPTGPMQYHFLLSTVHQLVYKSI